MKISIIGTGRVGSSIAFSLLFHADVDIIYLSDKDINRLNGEYHDLVAANKMLGAGKKIRICGTYRVKHMKADMYLICAGKARRNSKESMIDFYKENLKTVKKITKGFPADKTYIITNPSKQIAESLYFQALGEKLHTFRKKHNLKSGEWILDRKGYTNWGIVAEVWKVIG